MIEVSRSETIFYIAAIKKRNSNENYLIELEWDKAKEILTQFGIVNENVSNEDLFEDVIDSLEILDNRLVLLNPKIKNQKVKRKKNIRTARGSTSQPKLRLKQKQKENAPKSPKTEKIASENNERQDLKEIELQKSGKVKIFNHQR